MHSAATLLLGVLAAEQSRVPFYIAGGVLAAWAVIVSIGLGLRKADFPGSLGGQRVVMAISGLLVIGTISTAVVTSSSPAKTGEASASSSTPAGSPPGAPAGGPGPGAPAQGGASQPAPPPRAPAGKAPGASAPGASGGTLSSTPAKPRARTPKATTGTPPPSPAPSTLAPSTLALAADPSGLLSYDTKQLSARAGSVTITFTNPSPLEHDVTIAEGGKVLGATPTFAQGSRSLTLTLKPGTYTFYCSVPGHRQGGMEGALKVT